nr:DTW domain-containing protein [Myxococcota bacterium]
MRCRRPQVVCYCAALPRIDTSTRVVILQHPRERDMAIGTARMASLCLP